MATRLRSQAWFDDPAEPAETAIYLERLRESGVTRQELQSGRPIVGIAQTGSDIAPCNRIHLTLAARVRDGIRDAGGVPFEFPAPNPGNPAPTDRGPRSHPRLPRPGRDPG